MKTSKPTTKSYPRKAPKVSKLRERFGTPDLQTFRPGWIWPDNNGVHINAHGGGFIYVEGRYYWFGEHKIAGTAGNVAHVGIHCYSSADLYNWKDEGIALSVVKKKDHPLTEGCIIERPKVLYNPKTQTYVMWFHFEYKGKGYTGRYAGTAVSKNITGPYEFLRVFRPNQKMWPINVSDEHKEPVDQRIHNLHYTGDCYPDTDFKQNIIGRDFESGQMSADLTLFLDDDGKAYYIYTSEENATLHISLLNDDYLSCSGRYVRVFPGRFMEAPAIFKHHGKYYLIMSGCTCWEPNAARSAVADSIFGPWQELGNPCMGTHSEKTFFSQGSFILPVHGKDNAYIFIADRWNSENAIDGRYVWLPIQFDSDGKIRLEWMNEWDLSFFEKSFC